MHIIPKLCAAALLASTSQAALAASPDARIQAMESQIQALSKQLQELKDSAQQQQDAVKAQQEAVKLQQAEVKSQQADFKKAQTTAAKPGIANGRLSVSSSDGNFTAAVRALLQVDAGYYMQQGSAKTLPAAYGPDLSSGANLRRVFLGLQGKVFGDFSYYFLYDFGGASTETQGHLLYAYLQYDGLAPWAFRLGAYAPPLNIEDSTTSADLMFFERNSPSNLQRNISGAEGRNAISVLYTGERVFGALSLTGNKVQDGAKALASAGATAVANYDEQIAVMGRFSYLPISTDDAHWIVGVNGLHVFKLPDLVASGGATLSTTPGAPAKSTYSLSDLPEISIDSNGSQLVSTGAMGAGHVTSWGLETAGNYQNFYGQAGYYTYSVHRSPAAYNVYSAAGVFAPTVVQPSNNDFSGWYLQGSWILTGESRVYNPSTASFTAPKVAKPFSLKDGGWGALELVARFSDLNLNSHTGDVSSVTTNWTSAARTYTYYNTVRGGEQKIFTIGVNWYMNAAIKMALDYQYIDVSRLQAPAAVTTAGTPLLPALNGGQKLSTIALRTQLSL
jgi:phosphate-selective porin OprO and OprP